MQEPQKTPQNRRMWLAILAVVVVAVGGLLLRWQVIGPDGPAPVAAQATTTSEPDWTEASPPPTTARPGPRVLWSGRGSGIDYGDSFQAPARWRVVWSFDCSNFAKYGGGNFELSGDGDFGRLSVNTFRLKGRGTERMTTAGTGRVIVTTVCDRWRVEALAP